MILDFWSNSDQKSKIITDPGNDLRFPVKLDGCSSPGRS
jgi:hypothetical protein